MFDHDLVAELRTLATAARDETHKTGWPFDGTGVDRWSDNLNGLLGGPVGEYCAALDPDRLDAMLDVLEAARRPPLGYVAMSRQKHSDGPYGILIGRDLDTSRQAAEVQIRRFSKDQDLHIVISEIR
ncbi:hypothetical protein AB0C34_17420 [Nocardia sp. NPDC049220]|uniref:hypothetical protein n=1 Tax=Nocardia sp. NPDC049220 TaxID=3155273 RepID=UPI0033DF33A5